MQKLGLGTKTLGGDLVTGFVNAVTRIPDALGSAMLASYAGVAFVSGAFDLALDALGVLVVNVVSGIGPVPHPGRAEGIESAQRPAGGAALRTSSE
jgi:hypothetical protein